MYDLIHAMRQRIITSSAFDGTRGLGAILFEMTMDRDIDGTPTADYLWNSCGVVPFLKVDKGLADEENQAQCLKPMPELDAFADAGCGQKNFRDQNALSYQWRKP